MARSKRSVEKERFWQSMVRRQREEGVSIREFCRQNSLSEASFYAWRRELRKRAADSDHGGSRPRAATGRSQLIPVEVVGSQSEESRSAADQQLPLEICTPSGFRLRFCEEVSPNTILQVLHVMDRCQRLTCEADQGGASC